VAYRQLCAVTFAVLGWVTVGCGSGGGPDATPNPINEQPPGNRDQPINNATDRPPTNPDQPPNSSGALPGPGGGGAEGQCRAFCNSIQGKDCMGAGKLTAAIRAVCQAGCALTPQERLCANEIVGVVGCLSRLPGLCTDAFDEDQDDACDASIKAVNDCEEANEPQENQGACNTAGGCECETACQTCTCNAGMNVQALTACATGVCTP
jgi:hypothetical protein